jgi:Ser/Thr protein kinase RdoA (MazF antagonist)
VDVAEELHAGKQSRVFDAALDGVRVAIKLTESRLADRGVLTCRLQAVEALAIGHRQVVPPVRIDGALVQPIGEWLLTATRFVDGDHLEPDIPDHAGLLGRTLAHLHHALRLLAPHDIPPIAALDAVDRSVGTEDWQLLHGDFSVLNVIATPAGLRIFDFDDCGYGPPEYDLANSLYMVLFDSHIAARPASYEAFRPAFLAGYAGGSDRPVPDSAVDEMIAVRVAALGRWLDDLSSAPIGVRTSSPAWRETLASFVRSQQQQQQQ